MGSELLVLNPAWIPKGREFLSAIQTHEMWLTFQHCGWCFVWNGAADGGFPAFVDPYGSALNGVVIVTTLIYGVTGGASITILLCLWIAGFAQWWLAKVLGVGRLARMWSSLAVIVGGHLAGKMEMGVIGIILATATGGLVFAALLGLIQRPHSGVRLALLAMAAALFLTAGQGYVQIGFMVALPALAILIFEPGRDHRLILRRLGLAAGLTGLLAAPLILPLARFLPEFIKDADPTFASVQPLQYLPLNLVISDMGYYLADGVMGKIPYPYLYILYIGWVPVLLGIAGFVRAMRVRPRMGAYLGSSIFIVFAFASGWGWLPLMKTAPVLAIIRNPSLAAGLAVPLILGLSAMGVDWLWSLDWPRVGMRVAGSDSLRLKEVSTRWLLLIPLMLGLVSEIHFSRPWLQLDPVDPQVRSVIEALRTSKLEWVEVPFGEHFYIAPAVVAGLKVTDGLLRWSWKGRTLPAGYLVATRGQVSDSAQPVAAIQDVRIFRNVDAEYAVISSGNGQSVCAANGEGGYVDVTCSEDHAGVLTVKEHNWTGWKAWRDGAPVSLEPTPWLTVAAPAGTHTYQFRYLPWDVPLALGLALIGLLISAWLVWSWWWSR